MEASEDRKTKPKGSVAFGLVNSLYGVLTLNPLHDAQMSIHLKENST